MFFAITAPDESDAWPIHDDGREARWAFAKDGVAQLRAQGRLIWKRRQRLGDEVWVPYSREFASETPKRPHPTILLDVKTTRQAKAHAQEMLPDLAPIDTIKPEEIIGRVLEIATKTGDIVLDSFLGSGTTAAVAHKMGRRYIGIEMGDHAVTHCVPRLRKVIDGEQGGISESVGWQGGGGFAFYRLGESVFDDNGRINPAIRFANLAAHIWFSETGAPLTGEATGPWLGFSEGRGLALLYNGILGDKSVSGGNVLTVALLKRLRAHGGGWTGPMTVYGEASRIGPDRLKAESVTFKQTPYDVRAR